MSMCAACQDIGKAIKTSKKPFPPRSPLSPLFKLTCGKMYTFLVSITLRGGRRGTEGDFLRRGIGDCLFFALDSAGLALMSSLYLDGWALFAVCMVEVLTCLAPLKVLSEASSFPLPSEGVSNNCVRN